MLDLSRGELTHENNHGNDRPVIPPVINQVCQLKALGVAHYWPISRRR